MKSNENKMGISIVLTIVMVGLLITSSFILLLQFEGAEKLMYTLNSLGIIKSMDKESKELKEEIEEFPYISVVSNSDKIIVQNLKHDQRLMYYKIKKHAHLRANEIKALMDLMEESEFRYDYYISAMKTEDYLDLISYEYIYSILPDEYKKLINKNIQGKSYEYKEVYTNGIYFKYLTDIYKDDYEMIFNDYNMGYFETKEYYRRNNSFNSNFYIRCMNNVDLYKDINRYYIKCINKRDI
ncbi:hypothetical protein [Tepidibacter hydrothermalis]|uniref:Uncharacterized protein n=1 Tax=Tepidibacter hydrothermalis TaxID=3036126 RepID=A0ABY8EB36_9FIRM|nr:hypothetical protein [Tepidibacter hydrothermalis]WFD10119.1 hypothetical protein P4S50_17435 [Tepidibacter hydrothermalis]